MMNNLTTTKLNDDPGYSKNPNYALITVIVPVYNVEQYVRKCIASVVDQTYTNLEIILIDDGSYDNSPSICDEYASKDKRILVIHKLNGGVSSARNVALDVAKGQYIVFIDSDDYIENDMISFLHNNLVNSKSDISTCGHRYVYENIPRKKKNSTSQMLVLETDEALIDVLYNTHTSLHAWGKLYKASLFESIRFPEGRLYEDAGTTYKLISKSKRICYHTSAKYNYLVRQGSITGSAFTRDSLSSLEFAHEIVAFIKNFHPSALRAAENYLFSTSVTMTYLIITSNQQRLYRGEMNDCKEIILEYCNNVSNDNKTSRRLRVYAYTSKVSISALYAVLLVQNYARRAYITLNNLLQKTQKSI